MVILAPRHAELSEYLPTSSGEEDRCEDDEDYEVDEDEAANYDVGKFIENGKHFSHDHRLQVCEHKEEDDEHEDDKCRICGLPILSTPSYNCINGCKFFLHKQCALKFPPKLTHPSHGANFEKKHTLFIIKRSSSPNFIYECEDCNFQIHPLVAAAVIGDDFEIKIRHESHPLHELTTVCKEISCECDACGEKQEGFFFSCQRCNFWIHRDCTILPNVITFLDHPQPFILAFSLPFYQIPGYCLVCREGLIVRHNGVYFCPQSRTFTHVTCGKDKSTMSKTRLNLLQLPDDEWKTSPCLVIRRYAESKPLDPNAYYVPLHVQKEEDDDDDDDELTIEKYHNHPLILHNDYTESCINLVCDLCIQPTTDASTFYTCDLCPFVAHKI